MTGGDGMVVIDGRCEVVDEDNFGIFYIAERAGGLISETHRYCLIPGAYPAVGSIPAFLGFSPIAGL